MHIKIVFSVFSDYSSIHIKDKKKKKWIGDGVSINLWKKYEPLSEGGTQNLVVRPLKKAPSLLV